MNFGDGGMRRGEATTWRGEEAPWCGRQAEARREWSATVARAECGERRREAADLAGGDEARDAR